MKIRVPAKRVVNANVKAPRKIDKDEQAPLFRIGFVGDLVVIPPELRGALDYRQEPGDRGR
ncbi:hypothetical protein [Mesorhizobium kowhaii]|uniref:Uncharacterized protein n=1 Tax=Mesorhizobium kowhaii TaxID=1300272 RepID=A0A2W7C6M3_9HYPH|nr:hypothetical protein [Mesorhizobium kowhaii]PZV38812.1 hypothetical protein B5V02_09155 [Mesorhizobium kowhaii]